MWLYSDGISVGSMGTLDLGEVEEGAAAATPDMVWYSPLEGADMVRLIILENESTEDRETMASASLDVILAAAGRA